MEKSMTKTTNTGMAHTVDQEAQTVSRLTDTDHTVDILSKILSLSSMEKSLKIIKFQLISLEQPPLIYNSQWNRCHYLSHYLLTLFITVIPKASKNARSDTPTKNYFDSETGRR